MKTYNENIIEKEMILSRINLINRDSSRMFSEAGNLAEKTDDEIDQFNMEVKQLRENLDAVGQSILHMIRRSESDACVFFQAKDEVLSNLYRIQSNLEGIKGILDPNSRFYN